MRHSVLLILCHYKRFFFSLSLLLSSSNTLAVPEVELGNGFALQLTDYMRTQGRRGQLVTPDKHVISYQRFDQQCNDVAVIVIPGWSEPYLKYAEVIYDLRQHHYCVYTYDHRGQGLSSRNLADTQIGDVKDFYDYVNDLQLFDQQIVQSQPHKKLYILAHSMGGLIALFYAANTKQRINGLVMTAPMLKIKTDFWPEKVAYAIVSIMNWMGLGTHYVLGQQDWRVMPFVSNRVTHSRIRYGMGIDLLHKQPSLIIAGVSNRWLKTSLEYTWRLTSDIPDIRQNILLMQAGQEQLVSNRAEDAFCSKVRHCKLVVYPHARHELLMESDSIRDSVFQRLVKFFR